jgi:hypothetical protein
MKIAHEGPSTDISAQTVFRPALTTLVLQAGSTMPTDEFGVTTLTRRWKCRRDLAAGFFARRGDTDFQFPDLKLIDYTTTEEGAISTIEERYNGFIGGIDAQVPFVRERISNQLKEVQLHNASGSLTLVYRCPTLVREWVSDREPQFDDLYYYKGRLTRPVRVEFFRDPSGFTMTGKGVTAALLRLFKFEVRNIRVDTDPVPEGHIFRVREVVERQIVQENDTNAALLGGLGNVL